jgi:hypothetical protein
MKKNILLFLSVVGFLGMFAQNRLVIHLNSSTTADSLNLSKIDSIYLSGNETLLNFRLLDQSVSSFPLVNIDSLCFIDTLSALLPVVQTINVDKITQTSGRSGVVLLSPGGSPVTSKGICWSTTPFPTLNDSKYGSTSASATLYFYMASLIGSTTYFVRSYATNATGTSYGPQVSFTTLPFTLPIVETTSVTNIGGMDVKCVGNVSNVGGYTTYDATNTRGFCWSSTNTNPTIADSVASMSKTLVGTYEKNITFPTSNITYYVRAYATNPTGTAYGAVMTVKTTLGSLTYTLAASVTGSEYYQLIKTAMDSAMYYYNRYANFSGNIWVYYNSGIPTAQSDNRGSMGFGSNTWYMHVATAMHETAHWLGSGTTSSWKSFCNNGLWTGPTAVAMLKSLTGATLYCDNNVNLWHFWPYGLNQRSEVTLPNGLDYIYHVKIVNAMKTDCNW